jgi:hypothetical protein
MKLGIVVYSWSGHTLKVANDLRDALSSAGHSVSVLQIATEGERRQGARELGTPPDIASHEGLVLGAAVEAFSLSPVLSRYLADLDTLAGKKVACLVTQQFPYPWMGGNRAIRQMKKLCRAKGALVVESAVVNWAESRREKTTGLAVSRLARAF